LVKQLHLEYARNDGASGGAEVANDANQRKARALDVETVVAAVIHGRHSDLVDHVLEEIAIL
jgi:hypothetical protein